MADLSHDAETHRNSWLNGMAIAESAADTDSERLYWRHEREALQRFLDWLRTQQKEVWDNPELYARAKICAQNGHSTGVLDLIHQMTAKDAATFHKILVEAKKLQAKLKEPKE